MEKNVIITGINGFVGKHLANELRNSDCTVIGVSREDECSFADEYHKGDLSESWPENTSHADVVIHLAGLAAVGPSFDNPQMYLNLNSAMVTNMCEYYLKQDKKPRIVIVSSGSVYDPNQQMPISESGTIGFNSPYSVSKILVENQAAHYRTRGLDCVVVRPFNHIGPGQLPGFIVPDLYGKISNAPADMTVEVGNLNTKRDYTDVRDIVRAYRHIALAENLQHTTYNVCSGNSYSGLQLFEAMQKALDRDDVSYEVNPDLVRPTDIPEIIGNSAVLQNEFGWKPEITIDQTIRDFVEASNKAD